jgi:hypothetical protein
LTNTLIFKIHFPKKNEGFNGKFERMIEIKKKNWKIDTLNWQFLKSEYLITKLIKIKNYKLNFPKKYLIKKKPKHFPLPGFEPGFLTIELP